MHLFIQYYIISYACIPQIASQLQKIFEEDADDIFKSILGDVYRVTNPNPESYLKKIENERKRKITQNPRTLKEIRTTENIRAATPHTVRNKNDEITIKDVNMRRMNVKIAKILNQKSSQIPNFNNNDDDPSKITRRFDELRKKAIKGTDTGKNYLRLEYFSDDNITEISIEKNKTLALMEHYIYETRYKLPYAQLLRKKYRDNIKYKIGFCFALLRQLKQQQMIIYTTLVNQYLRTTTLHFHIKMYEKVVRLDIDIKDVILLVRRYERARKLALNPNYYDDS